MAVIVWLSASPKPIAYIWTDAALTLSASEMAALSPPYPLLCLPSVRTIITFCTPGRPPISNALAACSPALMWVSLDGHPTFSMAASTAASSVLRTLLTWAVEAKTTRPTRTWVALMLKETTMSRASVFISS